MRRGALLSADRTALAALAVLVGACMPGTRPEAPTTLRGYDIVITRQDSLARAIGAGLRRRGFTVRDHLSGGSRASAYLVTFRFRELAPPRLTWLLVRLADTRSGTIVAAVSAPLDSLGSSPAAWAAAVVDSLAAQAALRAPLAPT
ncbi:MAG TPA: hypothetical protein VEU55_10105 [Gemmatimonadales bacterium]|nr:hypothetical protein [Gemmatimonadales bacterium]